MKYMKYFSYMLMFVSSTSSEHRSVGFFTRKTCFSGRARFFLDAPPSDRGSAFTVQPWLSICDLVAA